MLTNRQLRKQSLTDWESQESRESDKFTQPTHPAQASNTETEREGGRGERERERERRGGGGVAC